MMMMYRVLAIPLIPLGVLGHHGKYCKINEQDYFEQC